VLLFGLSYDKQPERIIRAMDNRNVHILAHPAGRLVQRRGSRLKREPYDVDLERALRGWLTREDVLNTCSWRELKTLLKRSCVTEATAFRSLLWERGRPPV
jgi:DNA polymerase (family 10)